MGEWFSVPLKDLNDALDELFAVGYRDDEMMAPLCLYETKDSLVFETHTSNNLEIFDMDVKAFWSHMASET